MLMFLFTVIESSIDDTFLRRLTSRLFDEYFLTNVLGGYVVVVVSDSGGY